MPSPFSSRPLDPVDAEAATALAVRVGVHGMYVGNFLSTPGAVENGGEVYGFYGSDGLVGLAYFGSRGNLIVIEDDSLDPDAVAGAVHGAGCSWRIALGPRGVIAALADREFRSPLVHRRQLYYGVRPEDVPRSKIRDDVRAAERRDQSALLAAALDLNESDLHVDPRTVHKQWLKESIRRRIRGGQTFVIGPVGGPSCKLDLGSAGPLGTMVEGVYTFPGRRGTGLAQALVATIASRQAGVAPLVCLHVAEDNQPARRAYEAAGMVVMQSCDLMLRA